MLKTLLWVFVALLAGVWTGLVALTAQLTDWLLAAMGSGQVTDLAQTALQWPVPAWLGIWVDTAWLQDVQTTWVGVVQWLAQVLPSFEALTGWITPLLWVVWGLVMLLVLVGAVAGHWLLGRVGTATAL